MEADMGQGKASGASESALAAFGQPENLIHDLPDVVWSGSKSNGIVWAQLMDDEVRIASSFKRLHETFAAHDIDKSDLEAYGRQLKEHTAAASSEARAGKPSFVKAEPSGESQWQNRKRIPRQVTAPDQIAAQKDAGHELG